jgi:hypothetical protein
MTLATLRWLRIAAYGNFHDVPRCIVVLDRDFVLWLFDCPFDEALDEYREEYAVYRIGTDTLDAKRALRAQSVMDALPAEAYVGTVPVQNVEFDPTYRHTLFVHNRPFVPPPRSMTAS